MRNYLTSIGFVQQSDNHYKFLNLEAFINVIFYDDDKFFSLEAHAMHRSTVTYCYRVPTSKDILQHYISTAINGLVKDQAEVINEATQTIEMLKRIKL